MDEDTMIHLAVAIVIFTTLIKIALSCNFGLHRIFKVTSRELEDLRSKIATSKLSDVGTIYNKFTQSLGKTEYDFFKFLGVPRVNITKEHVSKGTPKLTELMKKSRFYPSGKVLDLCSGRGGWDAAIAESPFIDKIISVTLGPGPSHQGHEEYTKKTFRGREKVNVVYGDICDLPCQFADTVLFDGGEQKEDKVKEANDFLKLFNEGVMHQIGKNTGFILKVLTPTDPRMLGLLLEIQRRTGKGNFFRSNISRNTTMELYFISSPAPPGNIESIARKLLEETIGKAILGEKLPPVELQYSDSIPRQKVLETKYKGFTLPVLKPLDMSHSIAQISNFLTPDVPTRYIHWESLGTYTFGNKGSSTINQVQKAMRFINSLVTSMPGFVHWKITDTTPEGFQEIFREKVDMPPLENTPHDVKRYAIYLGLVAYFKQRGFKYRELSYDEVEQQVNRNGVASVFDQGVKDIREFMLYPDWKAKVENVRAKLNAGTPIDAIFTTIGKREKKKTLKKKKGSRMVAFLPIAMRILELKVFGKFIELTKPAMNKFGVGGMGLHDFGMRLSEVWRGSASSSDIAGFDTKISSKTLAMESHFAHLLGSTDVTATNLFRLYCYPHILVPKISKHTRMELLKGQGQRMSGTQITYPFNTFTRQVLTILQYGESMGWKEENYMENTIEFMKDKKRSGCISGDDEVFSAPVEEMEAYAKYGRVLNESGFTRKDVNPLSKSVIHHSLEEVEFCSHNYEKVSYFDSVTGRVVHRFMPTRNVNEIIGKSTLRVGGDGLDHKSNDAWLSMQGVNLLVLYHHLRLPRMVGSLYKSITPKNLILTDMGGTYMHKPWMREGEILDVINDVLFGKSTAYPVEGFRLRDLTNLGYLKMDRNRLYDPMEGTLTRKNVKIIMLRKFLSYFESNSYRENLDIGFMKSYLPGY